MIITTFQEFNDSLLIKESLQQAKDYLIKRYADKNEIKTSGIKDEMRKKILNDPRFIKIWDLTQKSPGYTPVFTKFLFDQGATMETLEELMLDLNKYKQNLSKDLSMPVVDYGKIEPTEEDHRPGWEILGDELRNIPRKIKLRKLYAGMLPKMRKQFSKATEEQIQKLTEISNQLDRLPPREGDSAKAWTEFNKTLGKYENDEGYNPQYNDKDFALKELIMDADAFIKSWGETDDELIKKLKRLGAQIGFLYNKDKYLVISTRSSEAVREIAGDTNYCIKGESQFWNYGEGKVQLLTINKHLPTSDKYSLTGITVKSDQSISDAFDRSNKSISGYKDLTSILEGIGFPKSAINEVVAKFPIETKIKLATEQFFKNKDKLTPKKIIASLINVNKGVLDGIIDEEEWESLSGIVAMIMMETEGLKASNFMEFFRANGILTDSGWEVFKKIIGDKYTKEDMEQIYDNTIEAFESIDYVLDSGELEGISPEQKKKFQAIKNNKSEILRKIEEKM